jgi:putative tryptophan/tyrosine transport system substrate-binding protein
MAALLCAAVGAIRAGRAMAQARLPLVAMLVHGSPEPNRAALNAFIDGMRELGYEPGRQYRLEVRFSDARSERLPVLARELLALGPDVIVTRPVLAAQAVQKESRTAPIVMATGAGALRAGLIASLARPGGNVTGLTNQGDELPTKLFQLLREVAPRARRVLVLSSGQAVVEPDTRAAARAAAETYGLALVEAYARTADELPAAMERCRRERCEAMVTLLDTNFSSFPEQVVNIAAQLRIPAVYYGRELVLRGGLIAYGADARVLNRRAATYVDKILKGARPADLPVEQPTQFELTVNQSTARALDLKLPQSILLRADQVID